MPDFTKFGLAPYRSPQLVNLILRRAMTGQERLNPEIIGAHLQGLASEDDPDSKPPASKTIKNVIDETAAHGLIRALHDRTGRTIAHQTTNAGIAYLQGRTTWPVPHRNPDSGIWYWWTPSEEHLHQDNAEPGDLTFVHPDDLEEFLNEELDHYDDPAEDDGILDAMIEAELTKPPHDSEAPPSGFMHAPPPN